jgi:hypothetical protein
MVEMSIIMVSLDGCGLVCWPSGGEIEAEHGSQIMSRFLVHLARHVKQSIILGLLVCQRQKTGRGVAVTRTLVATTGWFLRSLGFVIYVALSLMAASRSPKWEKVPCE